jgi:hypothetical protein
MICSDEHVSNVAAETDSGLIVIPGDTSEERLRFLKDLDLHNPRRREYFEAAIRDASPEIRGLGAFSLRGGDLSKGIPLLLEIMTTDASSEVRLDAAISLRCNFTCNGADYERKDVLILERDLPSLMTAIRDVTTGPYVLAALDQVWCEMTDEGRAAIGPVLEGDLPYGDEFANWILEHHAQQPCPKIRSD